MVWFDISDVTCALLAIYSDLGDNTGWHSNNLEWAFELRREFCGEIIYGF